MDIDGCQGTRAGHVESSPPTDPPRAGGRLFCSPPSSQIGTTMDASTQKVVQYLGEAHASEQALVRVLQSQIAMTSRGSYRSALETHLDETRDHAERVQRRLGDLRAGANPLATAVTLAESLLGQALALGKTPLDLLRGSGGEEKVLKNAKDACATEALEIATYTAIERLARAVDDEETAELAASIRADEERMLARILREIPQLTGAVVGADVDGDGSYHVGSTGAAEAVKRTASQARKVPGVARAEGGAKGALASEHDLAIKDYDKLTVTDVTPQLEGLSQIDLAKIDAYERKNQNRSGITERIARLRGDEPWPGYDELTVAEIKAVLDEGDDERGRRVRAYERDHKNRTSVLRAAGTQHSRV
jgi:ferritin-like metal-binding protein YciE